MYYPVSPLTTQAGCRLLWLLCLLAFTCVSSSHARRTANPDHYVFPTDAEGWSVVEPGTVHQKIYVSSSEGDDSNDGMSPDSPLRTIEQAMSEVREGSSDWVLLKRGDVFSDDTFSRPALWNEFGTGSDPDHPQLVGAYGEGPRPVLEISFRIWHAPIQNVFMRDLVFRTYEPPIDFLESSVNIFFENIRTELGENRVQANVDRITFYRCVILDAHRETPESPGWSNTHSNRRSGMYVSGTSNFLMKECILDHNGWEDGYDSSGNGGPDTPHPPSMFSHNIYFGPNNFDLSLISNISTRGASMGFKLVSPGHIEGNVMVGNNLAMGINDGSQTDSEGVDSGGDYLVLIDNVVLHAGNKNANMIGARGWGLVLGEIDTADGGTILRNIEAHSNTVNNSSLSNQNSRLTKVALMENNVVYQYSDAPNLDPDPSTPYPAPERNILTYNQSVGGEASLDDFYEEIRSMERDNWNPDYLARNIVAYMQEGFGLASPPAMASYEGWRQEHFSGSDLEDDSISGPNAVHESGYIPNMVRYALGLSPDQNPSDRIRPIPGSAHAFEVTYNTLAQDPAVVIELSSDLQNWSSNSAWRDIENLSGTEVERTVAVTVTENAPDSNAWFLRVRVENE